MLSWPRAAVTRTTSRFRAGPQAPGQVSPAMTPKSGKEPWGKKDHMIPFRPSIPSASSTTSSTAPAAYLRVHRVPGRPSACGRCSRPGPTIPRGPMMLKTEYDRERRPGAARSASQREVDVGSPRCGAGGTPPSPSRGCSWPSTPRRRGSTTSWRCWWRTARGDGKKGGTNPMMLDAAITRLSNAARRRPRASSSASAPSSSRPRPSSSNCRMASRRCPRTIFFVWKHRRVWCARQPFGGRRRIRADPRPALRVGSLDEFEAERRASPGRRRRCVWAGVNGLVPSRARSIASSASLVRAWHAKSYIGTLGPACFTRHV